MKEIIKRWARGDAPADIARDNDMSEATLRMLASSDAFRCVAEDVLKGMREGDKGE